MNLLLKHREQIERIRREYGHETSSHAFNTLYLWKNSVGRRLHLENELFSVCYTAKGAEMWMFPCGEDQRKIAFIREKLQTSGFGLCYVRPEDKVFLETYFPGVFAIEPSPGDSEYLIDRDAHEQLRGSRYAKLRGKLNLVNKEYAVSTRPLSEETMADAMEIADVWLAMKEEKDEFTVSGDLADRTGMRMYRELEITGLVLYLNGEPFGVAAGFPLTEDTFDLYLAKEKDRMPGLGYYLKHELLSNIPKQYHFVNLEDDLGISGLAVMKKQMLPVKMNEMWVAYVK